MREAKRLLRDAMTELAEAADWNRIPDDADYDEALKESDAWPTTLDETSRKCLASTWERLVRLQAALIRESITGSRSGNTPPGTQ